MRFTTREDGSTEVMFGGAGMGAALPTGTGNVQAIFRVGAGASGRLKAGQLSLLVSKPRSLKGVSNPLPPSGGADFAGLDEMRGNAAKGLQTLGRIVSLTDYQAFAAGFAGVTKAKAGWSWVGEDSHVFLTVAGEDEAPLDPAGAVLGNLAQAIAAQSVPGTGVTLRPARVARFTLRARLLIDPAYRDTGGGATTVLTAAEAALRAAYAYAQRGIGQPVRASDVITLLQSVAGVRAVDLDALHRTDRPVGLSAILRAAVPRSGVQGTLLGAEILLLSADPVSLEAI
jgi:predicted phage baseplate assembly protein